MSTISDADSRFSPDLIRLFSEIQDNPRSIAAYHQLVQLYRNRGSANEAEAFAKLLGKIKHADGPPPDQEQ